MIKVWNILGWICILCSCQTGKTMKDTEIAPELRKEMSRLTKQVIEGCAQNQPDKILEVSSNFFRKNFQENLRTDIAQKGFVFDFGKYRTLNEFYLEGLIKGVQVKISSGSAAHDYFLRINPLSEKIDRKSVV